MEAKHCALYLCIFLSIYLSIYLSVNYLSIYLVGGGDGGQALRLVSGRGADYVSRDQQVREPAAQQGHLILPRHQRTVP